MKKILLCSFFSLSFFFSFSQNWCPPGSTWHIRRGFAYSNSGVDGIIKMWYNKDTTVMGVACKQLKAIFTGREQGMGGPIFTKPYHTFYTYSSNNVIYLYNEINAFDTLINFNAQIGDTWLKPRSSQTNCVKRAVVTVKDTGHMVINGFFLKQITTLDSATVVADTSGTPFNYTYPQAFIFTERVLFTGGWMQNLFPTNCEHIPFISDGPPTHAFRCYEDNVFPLYRSTLYGVEIGGCDSQTGISSIEKNNIQLTLYPNPNNGSFVLELGQPAEIEVIDMLGKSVYTISIKETGKIAMEPVNLSPGFYTLKAKTTVASGQVKFIRQ